MAAPGLKAVREAITHLKMRRKGATRAQIRHQIATNYSGKVDFKKRGLLTAALKGLLDKGQVEKKGANYKLARVTKLNSEEEAEVPSRHHRRRHHGGGRRRHHRRRHRRRRSRHNRRRHHRRRRHHSRRRNRRRRR